MRKSLISILGEDSVQGNHASCLISSVMKRYVRVRLQAHISLTLTLDEDYWSTSHTVVSLLQNEPALSIR